MDIHVSWDADICCHDGNCVRSLPQVFMVEDGKFVIKPQAATEEQVRATVAACPSKALKIS